MSMPYPVRFAPLPNEWGASWLMRLAEGNRLPLPRLFVVLNLPLEATAPSPESLQAMVEATEVPLHLLEPRFALPADDVLSYSLTKGGGRNRPVLGVGCYQICPDCLTGDAEPYLRLDWVRRSVVNCPTHGGPLRDQCPHCGTVLQLPLHPIKPAPVPAPTSDNDKLRAIRRCRRCTGDVAASPPSPLQVLTPMPPQRLGPLNPTPAQWSEFQFALWLWINRFRVDQILGTDGVLAQPLRHWRQGTDALQGRWAAQIHTVQLLQPTPPWTVLERLRRMAYSIGAQLATVDHRSADQHLFLAWTQTQLCTAAPEDLLTRWPALVRHLVRRYTGAVLPPPPPPSPFVLTDAQWACVQPVLTHRRPLRNTEPRQVFELLLNHIVFGTALVRPDGTRQDALEQQVGVWRRKLLLGLALDDLVTDLEQNLKRTRGQGLVKQAFSTDPSWQTVTARLVLHDHTIELARQVHPDLHLHLLTQLVKDSPRSA